MLWSYEWGQPNLARFYHKNHQGSVIAVTSYGGAPITINSYDEYGIPAATNAGRFQYTGQIWLPELEMYYYKARIYSPTLGRFLQTDPIGYEDQYNLYAYVGNDPVNYNDPTGLCGSRVEGYIASNCRSSTDVGFRNDKTTVIGQRTVSIGGKLGSEGYKANAEKAAKDEATRASLAITGLTDDNDHEREFGFTIDLNNETQELVTTLYAGIDGKVALNVNKNTIVAAHTHNGVAAISTTIHRIGKTIGYHRNINSNQSGASPDDAEARKGNYHTRFFVFQRRIKHSRVLTPWELIDF